MTSGLTRKGVSYYDSNYAQYIDDTVELDMSLIQNKFLKYIPPGGSILDAGCGSGRDSKEFMRLGYQVCSIDASIKMVEATAYLTGQKAHLITFKDLHYTEEFDGIWACASVIHTPYAEIPSVLEKFCKALKINGVCYLSFKLGRGECVTPDGRFFTNIDEEFYEDLNCPGIGFGLIECWPSNDVRLHKDDIWINFLMRKTS